MDKYDLIKRFKKFVLNIVNLCDQLPNNTAVIVFSKQLIRCSSSMGANYRASCRAKSSADFINKLKIVEEETDEAIYFLDLLNEISPNKTKTVIEKLIKEANELLSIVVASIKTARRNVKKAK